MDLDIVSDTKSFASDTFAYGINKKRDVKYSIRYEVQMSFHKWLDITVYTKKPHYMSSAIKDEKLLENME